MLILLYNTVMIRSDIQGEWETMASGLALPRQTRLIAEAALNDLGNYHLPTADHCRRVGMYAVKIGIHENLPLEPLFVAGSLHDWGKRDVPRQLLAKTSLWTPENARDMRPHPVNGYNRAIAAGLTDEAKLIVRHHTFQPNGYPEGLPDLPPDLHHSARMVALADYYDASHRSDSDGNLTREEIRAKVLANNFDVAELVHELYETGVFGS